MQIVLVSSHNGGLLGIDVNLYLQLAIRSQIHGHVDQNVEMQTGVGRGNREDPYDAHSRIEELQELSRCVVHTRCVPEVGA